MTDDQKKKLYQRHLNAMRQKIKREQDLYYENFKNSRFVDPLTYNNLTDERALRRKKLLAYATKYVFLQNLEPIQSTNENFSPRMLSTLQQNSTAKIVIRNFLLIRNFFVKFFKIKSFLLIMSAFCFFSFEYYLRYYSSFSLKDVNITYETIIGKIPPFF